MYLIDLPGSILLQFTTKTLVIMDFVYLLRIERISLCIIKYSWSFEALRSLEAIIREECNVGTCEPRLLIRAIRIQWVSASYVTTKIMRQHTAGHLGDNFGIPNENCHVCNTPGGHNRTHYSEHVVSAELKPNHNHLLDLEGTCLLCAEVRDLWSLVYWGGHLWG